MLPKFNSTMSLFFIILFIAAVMKMPIVQLFASSEKCLPLIKPAKAETSERLKSSLSSFDNAYLYEYSEVRPLASIM